MGLTCLTRNYLFLTFLFAGSLKLHVLDARFGFAPEISQNYEAKRKPSSSVEGDIVQDPFEYCIFMCACYH